MSDSDSFPVPERKSEKEIVCAKCRHSNKSGSNTCTNCGSRLYVTCHQCGHRAERAQNRCSHCGQRLHRSAWRRLQKRLFPDQRKYQPFHFVLLFIMVYIAYKVIIKLAEYEDAPPS